MCENVIKAKINVDFNSLKSIKKAEKLKNEYENKGFVKYETINKGYDKFLITFI